MTELSLDEAEFVEGGISNVVIGAAAGGFWNAYQYFAASGTATFGGAALAIGSGIVGGAVAGLGGVAFAFYGGGLTATQGMAAGEFLKSK